MKSGAPRLNVALRSGVVRSPSTFKKGMRDESNPGMDPRGVRGAGRTRTGRLAQSVERFEALAGRGDQAVDEGIRSRHFGQVRDGGGPSLAVDLHRREGIGSRSRTQRAERVRGKPRGGGMESEG